MTSFLDEVRGRITELADERERLSSEITERQGRYALVTTELTHLEALVALHDTEEGRRLHVPAARDVEAQPVGAERAAQSGQQSQQTVIAAPRANETQQTARALPSGAPVATPPDGAWKAEAIRLLDENGQPMHYRDLYRALASRGFIFGGRNPEGVLLTGVSREKQIFMRMGRGEYWLAGREAAVAPSAAAQAKPRADVRRPRPIGRAHRRRG
ncbi:MAG TPA: hypothetical protein VMU55_01650 [Solirubrobacteraceae bacterium]|nr:hypothetical protein [Solirubrobacteraceae bacterium]